MRRRAPQRLIGASFALVLFGLVAAGCVATPIPEPPNVTPPEIELVEAVPDPDIRAQVLVVTGSAGAATANATLWAVNLDSPVDDFWSPISAPIGEDGSFNLRLDGEPGDELRLQVRAGEQRSAPLDVTTRGDGGLSASVREACLVVDEELAFGEVTIGDEPTALLPLRNDCVGAVEVQSIRWRFEPTPFAIVTSAPFTLDAGESASIEISFAPGVPGLLEEVFFLDLSGESPSFVERRPVTSYGFGVGE